MKSVFGEPSRSLHEAAVGVTMLEEIDRVFDFRDFFLWKNEDFIE